MKEIKIKRSTVLTLLYLLLVCLGTARVYIYENKTVAALPVSNRVIVIDAGHGGYDPGKVAADGVEEKGINLDIAKTLSGYLRQGGAEVIETRIADEALAKDKRNDLNQRVKIANGDNAEIFISIHQNSFPKSAAKGAQVFYHKNSDNGKRLAEFIQKRLKEVVDVENTRLPKENTNYYLLKQSKIPSVIVECGFLSNADEHDKLTKDEYRQKIAWAIYMGILDYYDEGVT
jgi:N-acetylmuramoyl-L-alanine amidase